MSRTTLCLVTAAILAVGSLALMALRHRLLGDEVRLPGGPGTWKITMLVQGRTAAEAHLWTATPLPTGQQQLVREQGRSDELMQKPHEQHTDRRELSWSQAPGISPGPFRIRYECWFVARPERSASEHHNAAPKEGEYLNAEPGIDSNHPQVAELARQLGGALAEH